jgi:hypothetical protein
VAASKDEQEVSRTEHEAEIQRLMLGSWTWWNLGGPRRILWICWACWLGLFSGYD